MTTAVSANDVHLLSGGRLVLGRGSHLTPSYRAVLDHHGWGGRHERLPALSRQGEWVAMAQEVDDEALSVFAAVGSPAAVAQDLRSRRGGLVGRLSFSTPYAVDPAVTADLAARLRAPVPTPTTGGPP